MEYTTSSENIYFLNDKNIASGIENACTAGFNAIPSQSAFVEKYSELTGQDGRLCAYIRDDVKVETAALSGEIRALSAEAYGYVDRKTAEVQASCVALGGKISDVSAEVKSLSNTVSADYVRKSGGSIASADITGDLYVGGAISSRYFSTNGIGNTVFSGSEGHGGVKFGFEHGPNDISVDRSGTTLDSFVKGEVRVSAEQAIAIANAYTDEFKLSAKNRFEADEAAVKQVSAVLDGRITTAWDQISAKIETVSANIEADLAHGIVSAKTYTDSRVESLSATTGSLIGSLSSTAKTQIDSLSATAGTKIDSLSSTAKAQIESLSATTGSLIDSLSATAGTKIDSLSSTTKDLIDSLSATTGTKIDSLSATAKTQIESLSATTKDMVDSLSATAGSKIDSLSTTTKSQIDSLSATAGTKIESLSATTRGLIDSLSATAGAKIDSLSSTTGGLIDSLSTTTKSQIDSLSVTASNQLSAKIASLSADAKTARTGMMLDMIGQTDGVITVGDRAIISDDIPTLPESKIDGLVLNYATKQEILNAKYTKSQQLKIERYAHDKEGIYLFDHEHSISSRIDCSDFIKDGMIETVELRDEGEGHSKEDGPYLVITWNADAGKPQTWLAVKKLFNVYKSTDTAGGLSVEGYNIYLNYDVVAKKSSVTPLQEYATQLSSPNGTIQQLSSRISSLDAYSAKQLELDGHIFHAAEGMALKDLIKASARDVTIVSTVKNNSMFDVNFEDETLSALSCSFTTSDGFKLGNRDIVLIHDHDASKAQIQLDDLNTSNVIVIHSGVSRYEFEALVVKAGDAAGLAKLSGGNEISGNNSFVNGMLTISSATVNDTLKVDFTKLVDSVTTSSVADISSWLCSQISASSGGWVEAVAGVRNELCTASCLISSWSEKADVNLSNALTGVINGVSSTLSGGISNHVADKNNPHNVTAGLVSSYLCSQTSSSVELDNKFKLYALSNDVSSTGQLENKFKSLSTYNDIKNQLSVDGYALTSNTSSTAELDDKFKLYALSNDVSSSAQLNDKFKTLSTYSETKNRLSSDGYALSGAVSAADVNLSNALTGVINGVSSTLSGGISCKVKVGTYSNGSYSLSSDDLSVVSISDQDYYALIQNGTVDPKVIYSISSSTLNAYCQRVISVAAPVSEMDAVNLTSMTSCLCGISSVLDGKISKCALSNDVSSSAQLNDKFKTLSTYSETKNRLSSDGYTLSSQVAKSAKDSIKIALEKAPAFNTILTGDASILLDSLDVRTITSVLIDIKKVFAALSA